MELKDYVKTLENRAKKPKEKGIHSYTHSVVKEICDYFGSYKEFGRWLGVARNIGAGELKVKFEYMKSKKIKSPNYLSTCTKKI